MKKGWNFENSPSLAGKTALITGANSGLGYAAALMLARRGAEVILACRSLVNAEGAAITMREAFPSENLHITAIGALDLADLSSIEKFADEIARRYSKLDILINNAGVMVPPLTRTKQGFELQFGVNHLGHFALTGRLLPLIHATQGARIVSMSSIAAWIGSGDFDDPNFEHRRYNKWRAYGTSKLANAMFIQELSRRLAAADSQAIAVASHPGVSATNLFKHSTLGGWYARRFSQSPERGALPAVFAATALEATNGSYWGPRGFMEMSGSPAPARIPQRALNPTACRRLWELSEQLTGVKY